MTSNTTDKPLILFVDDEREVTRGIRLALRKEPFKVLTANSAKDGLALLEKEPISIVISDERMPEMGGAEFLTIVKKLYPETIRLILSGQSSLESAIGAINEAGIYRFLLKPCDPKELVYCLEQALEAHEAHQRFGMWTVPIEGSIETVRKLKRRGFKLAVVSNAEGRVEQDLYAAGYSGLFGTVVDSHVVGVEKPDPKIFQIALKRIGADPQTSLYIGDVPSIDVAGSREASLFPVLLDRHDIYPDVDALRVSTTAALLELLPKPGVAGTLEPQPVEAAVAEDG